MLEANTPVASPSSAELPVVVEAYLPPQTYFSIREVAQITQVKPYVIRYWETQFGALRPARRESGQRKFTQKEVSLIQKIKELLYDKRFTIAGARQYLKRESRRGSAQLRLDFQEPHSASNTLDALKTIRKDLEDALRILKN